MIPAAKWLGSLSLPFRYKPFRLLWWHLPCHQPLLYLRAQLPGRHLSLSWSTVENRLPFSIVKESPPFPAEITTINVMSSLRQVWPITKIIFFLTFEVKIKKNKQTTQQLLWVCEWNHIMWPFKIKSYWAVLSCGTVYYAVQRDSNFWVCGWNPMM